MKRRPIHRRRIAVVTGTRAEYGTLRSTLTALRDYPNVDLQLIVTGMHLLPKFGRTIDEVKADGFQPAAVIPMQRGDDDPLDQSHGLARGIAGIAKFLARAKSDLVVVLGDRIEALAGALAAITTGRFLAHIHGGDVAAGDFDDSLRHAITKLAHLHFAATPAAAARIRKLGEANDRIFCVGAPGLDALRESLAANGVATNGVAPHALVVYHAHGRPPAAERRVMRDLLNATRAAGLQRTVILPNSDRGHTGVIAAIAAHQRLHPNETSVWPSLARAEFLDELIHADALIGNSSCGIIEAPFAGTPSVNIGARQSGREPGGKSVIQCSESPAEIRRAVQKAARLRIQPGKKTVYGDGRAGRRIARTLATLPLNPTWLKKTITY